MAVKSLLGKIRSRYAVSAAEINEQDIHQTIVIGVAVIVAHLDRRRRVKRNVRHK